ncbi:MAG: hypothetical protein JSS21_06935 [Proteobacteria bacterium]|nr:hypothetical protein [Pseudomonadota bacterium]
MATGADFAFGFLAGAAFFAGAGLCAGARPAGAFACDFAFGFAATFPTGFFGAAFLAGLLDFLMGVTLFADLDFVAATGFFAGLAPRFDVPDFVLGFAMSPHSSMGSGSRVL